MWSPGINFRLVKILSALAERFAHTGRSVKVSGGGDADSGFAMGGKTPFFLLSLGSVFFCFLLFCVFHHPLSTSLPSPASRSKQSADTLAASRPTLSALFKNLFIFYGVLGDWRGCEWRGGFG